MDQHFLEKLEKIVNDNLSDEGFGVTELANKIALSRYQIHRRIQNSKGQSVSQFIREIRLKKAMDLLIQENFLASEVAYKVGFSSPTYFTKCFGDYYGFSPGKIRYKQTHFTNQKEVNDIRDHVSSFAEKSAKAPENSIVILPFANLSNDPEQEYFCDGITEEIINTIARYPNIRVIGRTSSFAFKGRNEDTRHIGKVLQVNKILEGSIRKSGNRARISVHLINAESGFQIWSKKYDRQLVDVFALQDEIAEEIGRELKMTIIPDESRINLIRHTKNIKAYQQYFKGRSLFYKRGPHLKEAVKCFNSALELDPEYALAFSGLADTYVMLIFHGYLPARTCWPLAIAAAKKAIQYGPMLAETYNSIAIIALFYEWNWQKAESNFKKAIEINPVYIQAYNWYGLFYLVFLKNDINEGILQIKTAANIDPLSSYTQTMLCWAYSAAANYTEAYPHGMNSKYLDSNSIAPYLSMGTAFLWQNDYANSIKNFEFALEKGIGIFWYFSIYMAFYQQGMNGKASKMFQILQDNSNLVPTCLACAKAHQSDFNEASKLFKIACTVKDPIVVCFANTHNDNRYLRLIPDYKKILYESGFILPFKERFA